MTPCFIHTPNRTNEWNNFNPEVNNGIDEEDYTMEEEVSNDLNQDS